MRSTLTPLLFAALLAAGAKRGMPIVLPDTAKEKPQPGMILAAGPGERDDAGKRIAMDVKVGDKVLFAKYAGTELKLDGKKLLILRETDLLGIVDSK